MVKVWQVAPTSRGHVRVTKHGVAHLFSVQAGRLEEVTPASPTSASAREAARRYLARNHYGFVVRGEEEGEPGGPGGTSLEPVVRWARFEEADGVEPWYPLYVQARRAGRRLRHTGDLCYGLQSFRWSKAAGWTLPEVCNVG